MQGKNSFGKYLAAQIYLEWNLKDLLHCILKFLVSLILVSGASNCLCLEVIIISFSLLCI